MRIGLKKRGKKWPGHLTATYSSGKNVTVVTVRGREACIEKGNTLILNNKGKNVTKETGTLKGGKFSTRQ